MAVQFLESDYGETHPDTANRDLSPFARPALSAAFGGRHRRQRHARPDRQHADAEPAGQPVRRRRLSDQSETAVGPGRVPPIPNLAAVREPVDLAVIATPAATVPEQVRDCVERGVKAVIVISAGFSELGAEGQALERKVRDIARGKLRLVGPNCLGVIHPPSNLNASFAADMALPGNVALLSQSGAICTSILDWSRSVHVGFSAFVSVGAMLDVDFADLIDYFGDDPAHPRRSCCTWNRSATCGRSCRRARAVARTKPIIVVKSGRHEAAAQGGGVAHRGAGRLRRRLRRRLPPGRRPARAVHPRPVQHVRDPGDAAAAGRAGAGDRHQRRRPRRHGRRRPDGRRRHARRAQPGNARRAQRRPAAVLEPRQPDRHSRRRHAGALPPGRRDLRQGPEYPGPADPAGPAGDDRPDGDGPTC